MRHIFVKTGTALALCLTGGAPPLLAQEAALSLCDPDAPVLPCLAADGTVIEMPEALAPEPEAPVGEAPSAAPEAEAPAEPEPEVTPAPAEAEPTPEVEAPAPAPEEPVVEIPAEEPAPEAAPAIEPAPVEAAPTVEEAPAPEMEPAPDSLPAETDPADEAAPAAEPEPAAPSAEEPAEDGTPAATEAETAPAGEAAADEGCTPTAPEGACVAEAGSDLPVPNDGVDEAAASGEATATAAADDETDLADEAAGGDVTSETVTEDSIRDAGEDFETSAIETDGAIASAATSSSPRAGDSGLTDFQKALLIGLGAVAVGAILSNGDEVVSNSGDRVVVSSSDGLRVLRNDDVLLRQPGAEVLTRTYEDGSTRTIFTREDGSQVATIRAADGTALKRTILFPDGSQYVLFDDTRAALPVNVASLPQARGEASALSASDEAALRAALTARMSADPGRTFSLRQIRQIDAVRALAPQVEIDAITFATGSAAIDADQAGALMELGLAISALVREDPRQIFLIEGHTDAVGDAAYNLALSDRRAETVALALTQYFGVPPENLVTQGYGEFDLKIATQEAERQNRRAALRNITGLLQRS